MYVKKYNDTKRVGYPLRGVYMGPEYVDLEAERDINEAGDTDEMELDNDAGNFPDEPGSDDDLYEDAVEDNWTGDSYYAFRPSLRRRELSHDEIAREEYAIAIGAR